MCTSASESPARAGSRGTCTASASRKCPAALPPGQGLPVAKAELPEDLFLAHARTDDGLVARNEDLTYAIEGSQTNLQANSAGLRLDGNLSLIATALSRF